MQNKNVIIGLLALLLILVGVAVVNRDKFIPSQDATLTVQETPTPETQPSEGMMQTSEARPAVMPKGTTMTMQAQVSPNTMTKDVRLLAQNDSGQTGSAALSESDGKVTVTLTLTGGSFAAPQPAHIHTGSCPNPGDVVYPLSNVIDGKSITTLNVSMADLIAKGPLAINVHKSAAESSVYTACGDLK